MRYTSLPEVLKEGAEWHSKGTNGEGFASRQERLECFAKASRCYEFILEHEPESALALSLIGTLNVELGKWGLGYALLRAAARLEPNEHANWNMLGIACRRMDKLEEARGYLEKALTLTEDTKERIAIMHNLASTYINEGEPQKCVDWCNKIFELDPNNAQVRFNYGLAQLELGNYAEGWDGYEIGRGATTWSRNYSHPGRDVANWDGSPGRNIVVFGEQGVGDEILFAHALSDLIRQSKSVILDCHPRLVNLFKRSFPTCTVYGTRKEEAITWPGDHELDAKVPFGSLHRFYRRSAAEFPKFLEGYIKPDPAYVRQYAGNVAKLRVGISWIGGTRDTHIALRSLPLERLAPILSTPGVEFVSLQYTKGAGEQVKDVRERFGWDISHDDEMNADLDRLFGCIAGLDLVITVLTSNVHFAGSMNVPTWVLTPIKAPWQFMQESMPWYPQTKLLRQEKHGEWDGVINAIARDLVYAVEAKRAVG